VEKGASEEEGARHNKYEDGKVVVACSGIVMGEVGLMMSSNFKYKFQYSRTTRRSATTG